jgi:Hemerythrin HHE cation binding domain
MPENIIRLDSPIDVMYPIHKALRAEAAAVEAVVRRLPAGESCQACVEPITRWATALEYHAVMEDKHMTAPLDRPAARTNEAEHQQLTAMLTDLQTFLGDATAQGAVSPRTLRHLLGKIVALRVAQDDHLEEEEERILPVIRQHLSEAQQCAMVRPLLIDQTASRRGWVVEWLTPHITTTEQQLLADLVARFEAEAL